MDRETAMSKVRKCLSLANSSNEAEAAAALRQAQKLMKLHGISDCEATMVEIKEISLDIENVNPTLWEFALAQSIAKVFGIVSYRHTRELIGFNRSGRLKSSRDIRFFGPGGREELAAHAFKVLHRVIVKSRTAYVKSLDSRLPVRKMGSSFAVGFALNVGKAVAPLAPTAREQEALEKFMMDKGLVQLKQKRPTVYQAAFDHGAQAGQNTQALNVPMGGELRKRLA